MRITGTTRPVDRVVAGIVDAADETEPHGEASAPLEGRLAPAAVVEDGEALVVVAAAEHGGAVVLDRVETHHAEPGHEPSCATNPEGLQSCLRSRGYGPGDRSATRSSS